MATRLLFILSFFPLTLFQASQSGDWLANDNAPALQFAANSNRPDPRQADTQSGREDCGWIGVEVSPMTRPFADSLGMTELYGAIFDRPQPGSPAAQAKIEAGDVLTTINGEPLRSWNDFEPTIAAIAPGTTISLDTYRDGQLIERKVTLGYSKCSHQP
jgi:S1-C subfamily serine protease